MNEEEFQELLRYQATLSRQVVQEAKTDKKIKLLGVLNELSSGKKKVQTAAVLHEAETRGLTEAECYDLLDELTKDGLVADAGEGYVRKT